jgi:small subunit ribosomal protein S14
MARTSNIVREHKREKIVAVYKDRRDDLRQKRSDINLSADERWQAQVALQQLPRDSSPFRLRNRCALTGRPRGVFKRFKLSRTQVREQAMLGNLPGLKKASW